MTDTPERVSNFWGMGEHKQKIAAKYEDGVLKITVPHDHNIHNPSVKHIAIN